MSRAVKEGERSNSPAKSLHKATKNNKNNDSKYLFMSKYTISRQVINEIYPIHSPYT